MKKHIALLGIAALLLTGCGGPKKDATYDSASDLREAVLAAEGKCPGETISGDGEEIEELIRCNDKLGLRTYSNADSLGMAKTMVNAGYMGSFSMLAGPNWIIQGEIDDLAKLQESLEAN